MANLLFINLYSGKVERGAESFTHQLAHRLSAHHHVDFIKGSSTSPPNSQFIGSITHRLSKRLFLDRPAREVFFFTLSQLSTIARSNYDAIFPLNGFWQLLLLKLLQPFKGYRIIVTGHSGPGWDDRFNLYLHPNIFISLTPLSLTWAQKTCSWTKSILIPLGINKNDWQVKPASIKLAPPIILCPAALVPYKRIDLAIRAVAHLKSASLLVLGKGPHQSHLTTLGHQLLGNRFLLKSVSHSTIPAFFQAASLVTLPSAPQENSPMIFLEALAAGKLVVATNTPRHRWILGKSGIFTDPTNITKYSQTLQKALNLPPPDTSALAKFSWGYILNQYLSIISP